MKTKSKLREKLVELHKKYSIDWELQDEQFFDDAIQAFSEELDELARKAVDFPYTMSGGAGGDIKQEKKVIPLSAIKEMKSKING